MAARQNQGLHIALIIFFLLTIVCAVVAFLYFQKSEDLQARLANSESAAKTANENRIQAEDIAKRLREVLGVPSGAGLQEIEKTQKEDFDAYGAASGTQKNYRALVKDLHGVIVKTEQRIVDSGRREQELNDKAAAEQVAKIAEITQYKGAADKTSEELAAERKKFGDSLNKLNATKEELAKTWKDKLGKYDSEKSKLTSAIEAKNKIITTKEGELANYKNKQERERVAREQVDGKITWVNQTEQLVWIDLGSEDGLRQQVTFAVVDSDSTNPAQAKAKGNLEVVRVLDAHMAEARIVSDEPSNPLMPGDLIFSSAWQPGRAQHFGLIGFMDIDGDGVSDRELIKRVITANGGVIDMELTDDGKLVGELLPTTDYLIQGEEITEKDKIEKYSKTKSQISTMPVQRLPVFKFLEYVGYKPDTRTIALGRGARPSDFKPRAPERPRKSLGNVAPFPPKPDTKEKD